MSKIIFVPIKDIREYGKSQDIKENTTFLKGPKTATLTRIIASINKNCLNRCRFTYSL